MVNSPNIFSYLNHGTLMVHAKQIIVVAELYILPSVCHLEKHREKEGSIEFSVLK
jgi:hypothetical protein